MASTATKTPTSDEAVSGTWTGTVGSRFAVVDDYPDTAGTDELTHGTTAGNLTFGFSAFSIPAGSINISVFVDYYDYKNGSQTCNIAGRLKVGGSYFASFTHNPGNGSANRTQRTDTWATNPKTSAAWTVAQVNGTDGTNDLQAFGWVSTDASPSITLSSVQVRVTYDAPVSGTLSSTLGTATVSGTATSPIQGTESSTLGAVTVVGTGTVVDASISGTLAVTLDNAAVSGTGTSPIAGTTSSALEDANVASTGTSPIAGTLSSTLEDASVVAAGTAPKVDGVLSVTLEDASVSGSGSIPARGILSISLDEASVAGSGQSVVDGNLASTLEALGLGATGAIPIAGVLSETLGCTVEAQGNVPIFGFAGFGLEDLVLVATGGEQQASNGQLDVGFEELGFFAQGTQNDNGQLSTELEELGCSALGQVVVRGTLSRTLDDCSAGSNGISGQLACYFEDLGLVAMGTRVKVPVSEPLGTAGHKNGMTNVFFGVGATSQEISNYCEGAVASRLGRAQ